MELSLATGVLATTIGTLMALSPLLQARKVISIGDASEISPAVYVIMVVNGAAWFAHGVATSDPVLVIPNAILVIASAITLAIVHRLRRPVTRRATASRR